MTPEELRHKCETAHDDFMTLVIPRTARGESIQLCPGCGIRGRVLDSSTPGRTTAAFSAKAVLAWLDKQEAKLAKATNNGE